MVHTIYLAALYPPAIYFRYFRYFLTAIFSLISDSYIFSIFIQLYTAISSSLYRCWRRCIGCHNIGWYIYVLCIPPTALITANISAKYMSYEAFARRRDRAQPLSTQHTDDRLRVLDIQLSPAALSSSPKRHSANFCVARKLS